VWQGEEIFLLAKKICLPPTLELAAGLTNHRQATWRIENQHVLRVAWL
jgi:hypothetical protein